MNNSTTLFSKCIVALIATIVLLFISNGVKAQYFMYSEQKPDIKTRFIRSNIEAHAKDVIFNAFWVKNSANRTENLTLNISVPQGWNVIGPDKVELTLAPLDSTVVPIRIGVGAQVNGNIGYSIIASVVDSRGNTIKNDYCFVKIPAQFDLNIKIKGNLSYLDPVNRNSQFGILVQNRGNREETVSFLLDGNRSLRIGSDEQYIFAQDFSIRPYSDTTLTFNVELVQNSLMGRKMYPLNASISSPDTTLNKLVWFRRLESILINEINANEKPLTIELNIQGLLDETTKPTYSATIIGKTLLKGNDDFYYYYRNYASETTDDLYKKTRLYAGTNIGRWNFEFGDNLRLMEGDMYGRGFFGAYNGKKMQYAVLANKDINSDMQNFGGRAAFKIGRAGLFAGANYNQQDSKNYKSAMGYLGSSFTLLKQHQFYTMFAYNQIDQLIDGKQKHNEYGTELRYTSTIGKTHNYMRFEYHSPLYNSNKGGRTDLAASSNWTISNKNRINFMLTEYDYQNTTINNNITQNTNTIKNGELKAEHTHTISKEVNAFWGPTVRRLSYENNTANSLFKSMNYGLIVGSRINVNNNSIYIVPRFELALTRISNNPYHGDTIRDEYNKTNYQYFSLNIRSNKFGLIAFFTTGPRNLNDQQNYANNLQKTRRLIFMPSYSTYIYKDIINLNLSLGYNNDLVSKFTYSNVTGQITCNLRRGWSLHALAQYNTQKRTRSTENIETYQTFYAEATIRKEFDIQQPRVKYHDVDLLFFKDFNGNYVKEENEPGINNVLVEIEKINSDVVGSIPSDISTAELLSNNLGRVRFENIPEGIYSIKYNPLGNEAGNYSKGSENVQLVVDKSGEFYFPFVEKNKVFGKIVLNRSKLSGLGNVDLSNIRITTTDSRGNMFSTLTNKNGEFVIFAPVTDEYVVTINNIFYENFDLRQNNFRVQFNGYKQFEVNFVFDEKVRRINFAQAISTSESDIGVPQVRRTNLRGTIKDETTLNPLRARINLVNLGSNIVVSSVYTNPQTGDYALSFAADDNYVLEVVADDYWYHSENLALNQVTTFMNVNKDIMLRQITIGSKLELNARFDVKSTTLLPETIAELNRLMRVLRENRNIKIEVQGFADNLEQIDNPKISEERAKVIAKYIIEHGFGNAEAKGMGNSSPVNPGDTEESRMLNRRVEIIVTGK